MNAMRILRNHEQGAASLITVILLAIILSVITTGMLRLSVQDARQATDDDLTNRAFYAAESGLNDALRFIEKALADPLYNLNGDVCATPAPGEPADVGVLARDLFGNSLYNTEYVCQLIDLEPEVIRTTIPADGVVQFPLISAGGPPPTGIEIRWHNLSEDHALNGGMPFRADGDTSLPNVAGWGAYPALLRTNLFSTPQATPFTRSDIQNFLGYLSPSDAISSTTTQGLLNANVISGACTTDPLAYDGFACSAIINNMDTANHDYKIRLSGLYASAQVEIRFTNGSEFFGAQALVDVTGRAADVYRRVQASVNLSETSAQALPNYVIRSAGDVCKVITLDPNATYNCPVP